MKFVRSMMIGIFLMCCFGAQCMWAQESDGVQQNVCAHVQEESLDDLDALVDEAAHDDAFMTRGPLREPSGLRLFFMKLGVPLVGFYTSAVLKYRIVKAWLKQNCLDPLALKVEILFQRQEKTNASESTGQK